IASLRNDTERGCHCEERSDEAISTGMSMAAAAQAGGGALLANLMHFARTLRAAGLPVGPGKVIDAVAAVGTIGITDRSDFYWTLHAVFVNRPDQRLIFDQAFHVFWRNPDLLKKMMGLGFPQLRLEGVEDQGAAMARRLAEALHPDRGEDSSETEEAETELDAAMTFS